MVSRISIEEKRSIHRHGQWYRGVARAGEGGHQTDTNGFTSWLLISKFEAQGKLIRDSLLERRI
jgi:hypothetical protein